MKRYVKLNEHYIKDNETNEKLDLDKCVERLNNTYDDFLAEEFGTYHQERVKNLKDLIRYSSYVHLSIGEQIFLFDDFKKQQEAFNELKKDSELDVKCSQDRKWSGVNTDEVEIFRSIKIRIK